MVILDDRREVGLSLYKGCYAYKYKNLGGLLRLAFSTNRTVISKVARSKRVREWGQVGKTKTLV